MTDRPEYPEANRPWTVIRSGDADPSPGPRYAAAPRRPESVTFTERHVVPMGEAVRALGIARSEGEGCAWRFEGGELVIEVTRTGPARAGGRHERA